MPRCSSSFPPTRAPSSTTQPSTRPADDPPCVWGGIDAIRQAKLYLALRMPNPLDARQMVSAGPIDVYGDFYSGLSDTQDAPGFQPYTDGADFFTFAYDWRQEIATVTAPLLGQGPRTIRPHPRGENRHPRRPTPGSSSSATAWAASSRGLSSAKTRSGPTGSPPCTSSARPTSDRSRRSKRSSSARAA